MKLAGIIPAAGMGSRFKGPSEKIFTLIQEKPLILHTIEILFTFCTQLIIAVKDDTDQKRLMKIISETGIDASRIDIIQGGSTRTESVKNALQMLHDSIDTVCIHDGARPLLAHETISLCIEAMRNGEQAAVVGVPAKDTIKIVENGYIVSTPERSTLMHAQTPQIFSRAIIEKAYATVKDNVTDDSTLVERMGVKVKIIEGTYTNIKITTIEDLSFAERTLEKREHVL